MNNSYFDIPRRYVTKRRLRLYHRRWIIQYAIDLNNTWIVANVIDRDSIYLIDNQGDYDK